MQIWIIDDDRDMRESLSDSFEGTDHTITCFADGSLALLDLANSRRERPDVILLDMLMPGMPGKSFLATLAPGEELGRHPGAGAFGSHSQAG